MIYSGLWKAAALLGLIFGYAVFFGGAVPYLILYTGAALVFICFTSALAGGRITASCSANCATAQIGSKIRVTIEVTNFSRLPVPWVQCWVAMPPMLGLPGNTVCYNVSLAPKEKRIISEDMQCYARGVAEWGQITLRTGDIFGLFSRISKIGEKRELAVLPETCYLDFALSHRAGISFSGIRGYEAGDSMAKIHWKASAKTGNLLVKEYEDYEPPELTILLDLMEGHHAGAGLASSVEKAITLAASLASAGLGRGHRMGLVVCSGEPITIAPGHGSKQLAMIMHTLARVNAGGASVGWPTAADRVTTRARKSGVLLITGALSEIDPQIMLKIGITKQSSLIFSLDLASFGTTEHAAELSGIATERLIGQGVRVIPVRRQTDLRTLLGGQKHDVG